MASSDSILLAPRQVGDQVCYLGRDWGHASFNGRIQGFRVESGAPRGGQLEADMNFGLALPQFDVAVACGLITRSDRLLSPAGWQCRQARS